MPLKSGLRLIHSNGKAWLDREFLVAVLELQLRVRWNESDLWHKENFSHVGTTGDGCFSEVLMESCYYIGVQFVLLGFLA